MPAFRFPKTRETDPARCGGYEVPLILETLSGPPGARACKEHEQKAKTKTRKKKPSQPAFTWGACLPLVEFGPITVLKNLTRETIEVVTSTRVPSSPSRAHNTPPPLGGRILVVQHAWRASDLTRPSSRPLEALSASAHRHVDALSSCGLQSRDRSSCPHGRLRDVRLRALRARRDSQVVQRACHTQSMRNALAPCSQHPHASASRGGAAH